MRTSTIFLQSVCVILGVLFIVFAFTLADHVLVGGLVFGSLMCMCAALLGADHTTNSGTPAQRQVFKVLAVISALPLLGFGFHSVAESASQSDWPATIFTLLKVLVAIAALAGLALDTNPKVRALLHRLGLSSPQPENETNKTL
jgi:uncharacterized membrane protein